MLLQEDGGHATLLHALRSVTLGDRLGRLVAQFARHKQAGIAVLFGIMAPVLLLLMAGGVELAEVIKAKNELQWDVDTAALNAARELQTDQSQATASRAQSFAASLAANSSPRWTVTTSVQSDASQGSITVSQTASRPSFFGSLLPPGGWHIAVTSTAATNGRLPLCVLGLQPKGGDGVSVHTNSTLTAGSCLVQSNQNISVDPSSSLQAAAVRSVGASRGSISPAPITDAPAISDPFYSLPISVPRTCAHKDTAITSGTLSLNPGVHCGNFVLSGSSSLVLNPGEHYFTDGQFTLKDSSQVVGNDVVLIFKGNWLLNCKDSSLLSLEGRQNGPYAGFVLITDRGFGGTLVISTDHARQLHGTIYLPNATLEVKGDGNKVADQSPWTVVVAKAIKTDGTATLVINSNYASSSVPVPTGVGLSGDPHIMN